MDTEKNKNFKDLEKVIAKAIKKVGAKKENDLCKYIPSPSGGYMHHFTLKKLKKKNPNELVSAIEEHIIESENPEIIAPKPRAPRGSRKRMDQLTFSKMQLERMRNIARLAGDTEIMSILSPKRSLAACKRELIQSIKKEEVDEDLWIEYKDSVNTKNASLEGVLT